MFFYHLPSNNNIQQYSLETKKQFLFDNLSEELKTWSSDNALSNQTSYKFIAMQRSGFDPYLGGGNITIEGHKSDDNHEWQKATTYYNGTKFIKFRDKILGIWSDWEKVVFNSDLTQYLSINQYMKNFVIGSKGTKTIQLPSGIFLVSWGQYGAWSDKGTAIVYNSTYQSTASKDIYILFQRETSITLSQSIDGKLTITNSIVAEMPISIIEIGGPKFYDFTV